MWKGLWVWLAAFVIVRISRKDAGFVMSLAAPFHLGSVTARWTDLKLDNTHSIQVPRSGHVAWTSKDGDLFVFGGYAEVTTKNEKAERFVVNDLWRFRENDGWTDVSSQQSGDIPPARLASAAATAFNQDGKEMVYLMGGWDPQTPGTGGVILDTVHELDLETLTWKQLATQVPDGPTSRHVVVSLHDHRRLLVHNHRCVDRVIIFDAHTGKFAYQPTTGIGPSPRGLHAAIPFSDGTKVLMFGGAAQAGDMSNEVFVLNCQTWHWTPVDCSQSIGMPTPRASPCLHVIKLDQAKDGLCQFVVFGGADRTGENGGLKGRGDVWILYLNCKDNTGCWERLQNDANDESNPPGRNAATLSSISKNRLLLHGGWSPFQKTYNDNFVLAVTNKNK